LADRAQRKSEIFIRYITAGYLDNGSFNSVTAIRYIVFALLCCIAARGQSGPAETMLAGIDIHQTRISDIINLYGEPEGVYAAPAPYLAGTKQYKWGRLTVTLKVLTEPTPRGDSITAIQIDGDGNGKPISETGRGLKLGDKPQSIKKVYGIEPTNSSANLTWPSGERLLIHLGTKGRVDRIELSFKSSAN
jgi:hypothetical protein